MTVRDGLPLQVYARPQINVTCFFQRVQVR